MVNTKVNNSIIKIVGLLGEYPRKESLQFQKKMLSDGFREDEASKELKIKLKDMFYRDFREIMFIKDDSKGPGDLLSRRFYAEYHDEVQFHKVNFNQEIEATYVASIRKSEIYFFGEEIALFAITIEVADENASLKFFSDLINQIRNFDAKTTSIINGIKTKLNWHELISKKYLSGTKLRDQEKYVKADDYSGSKFKVYSVFDFEISEKDRELRLFEVGTSSPLNSVNSNDINSPHPEYFDSIMKNRISIFKNWQSLCLFDSFTTIGTGILKNDYQKRTWEDTYFRIYLFRLFFKYNLFMYNTDLHENTVKLRNQFEKFLNNYNLSHISFNFLPNEIFNRIGEALHLDEELNTFQNRINRISTAIQEEKQSRTNALLQFVSVLGGLGSVQPVFDGLSLAQKYLGWNDAVFYTLLVLILLGIGVGLLAFLMPEVLKKIRKNIFGKKTDL